MRACCPFIRKYTCIRMKWSFSTWGGFRPWGNCKSWGRSRHKIRRSKDVREAATPSSCWASQYHWYECDSSVSLLLEILVIWMGNYFPWMNLTCIYLLVQFIGLKHWSWTCYNWANWVCDIESKWIRHDQVDDIRFIRFYLIK